MAEEPQDRDELRRQREEAEAPDDSKRNRMIVAYAIVSTIVIAVVVVVIVLVSGGGDSSTAKGDAHINLNTAIGSTNGIVPDERLGTKPPAVKVANLAVAAKQAGCMLRLRLHDEGHQHIPP